MLNRFRSAKKKDGFTLVELIVVLVILAILAAILVPTLIGYINKAKDEKDYATAQTVRVAAQAALDEMYADGIDVTTGVAPTNERKAAAGDGDFTNSVPTYGGHVLSYSGATYTSFTFTASKYAITSGNVVITTNNTAHTYYLRSDGAWYKTAS